MNRSRSRANLSLSGLLAIALAALIFILVRGPRNLSPTVQPTRPPPTQSPAPTPIPQTESDPLAPIATARAEITTTPDRPPPLIQWANDLLDTATPYLTDTDPSSITPYAWLHDDALWGPLAHSNNTISVGDQAINSNTRTLIEIFVPDPSSSGRLLPIGHIERQASGLTLSVENGGTNGQSLQSLFAEILPDDVLKTLVQTATSRNLSMVAAYWEVPGSEAALVLAGREVSTEQAALPATSIATSVPPTPTATLVYQPDIRQIIQSALAPPIDTPPSQRSELVDIFAENHIWTGVLAWEQNGPTVAGRPLNLDTADQLELFRLETDGSSLATRSFLQADRDGHWTLIRTEAAYRSFWGFRLDEITHWLILLAEENGGHLEVAYDSLGQFRALTIIRFRPSDLPPDS